MAAQENPIAVHKVGGIFVRGSGADTDVLIIRPKPKRKGEMPHFGLPRGSRQYWHRHTDGSIEMRDARDAATAQAHAAQLEPVRATFEREMLEEVGVTGVALGAQTIHDIGIIDYHSPRSGITPIHWFLVMVGEQGLALQPAEDALEVRWVSLPQMASMAAEGSVSAGYLRVVEEALATLGC
jgi:8-oxo-dGTP pyrophosphatase MutT (NUDIX family)